MAWDEYYEKQKKNRMLRIPTLGYLEIDTDDDDYEMPVTDEPIRLDDATTENYYTTRLPYTLASTTTPLKSTTLKSTTLPGPPPTTTQKTTTTVPLTTEFLTTVEYIENKTVDSRTTTV